MTRAARTPGPHLDIEVVHGFDGRRWLTFMATALPTAVFILIQEERGRTHKWELKWDMTITILNSFVPAPPHTRTSCRLGGEV